MIFSGTIPRTKWNWMVYVIYIRNRKKANNQQYTANKILCTGHTAKFSQSIQSSENCVNNEIIYLEQKKVWCEIIMIKKIKINWKIKAKKKFWFKNSSISTVCVMVNGDSRWN